jgi:dTDP-4-dehydrorhamnose reductase
MLASPARLREHSGIYNLSAGGQCTRYLWAERIIETAKTRSGTHDGWAEMARTTTRDFPVQAPRPLYTLTNNRKIRAAMGIELAPWDASLRDFMLDHYGSTRR